jgi:hypothetical protein
MAAHPVKLTKKPISAPDSKESAIISTAREIKI